MPDSSAPQPQDRPADPYARAFRAAKLVLLLALAGYGVRCVRHGRWEDPKPGASRKEERHRHNGTDFTAYYSAGELARKGENLYDWRASSTPRRPFIYPPFFAVFPMAPLSLLSHNAALGVFYALNVALLLGALWLLRKLLWPADAAALPFWRRPEVGLALAVLACGRFLDSNMVLGQANVFVLALVTLGLYALARQVEADAMVRGAAAPTRGTNDSAPSRGTGGAWLGLAGGLAVAAATTIKLTPGLFGLYFLWARRGWAMAGGALGLALCLFVLPAPVLGFSHNLELLGAFAAHAKEKAAGPGAGAGGDEEEGDEGELSIGWGGDFEQSYQGKGRGVGISLRGTLLKLLTKQPPSEDRPVLNVAEFAPSAVAKGAAILGLVLLACTVALTAPRWARADAAALALSWGLVATTILLLSPLTRKAHAVILLVPVAALLALLQRDALDAGCGCARKLAFGALAFLGLAGLLSSPDVVGDYASEWLHTAGLFTLALLGLHAALAAALWSRRAAALREGKDAGGG
ncbi:MAG: DUF2029 domain-containing protein [Planctomycetota bacterium]|nr:DUF2029 domain-containing protein [Planctomycetota bacterium]